MSGLLTAPKPSLATRLSPRASGACVAIYAAALALLFPSRALAADEPSSDCKAGAIERADPRFDDIFPSDARLRCLAGGYTWVEGPAVDEATGTLYFSDIPANSVLRIAEGGAPELYLKPAGYSGANTFQGYEPGSNGLAFDAEGRLLLCQHGDRRIVRLEKDGARTVLADRFEGKRFNSPNDVVVAPDGSLYFTDPPFGLPKSFDDPSRELDFAGVFRRSPDGTLTLLVRDLEAPNGIALSPDGRTLYVSNASRKRPVVMAYELRDAGASVGESRVFFDATRWLLPGTGVPDGIESDARGNLLVAGPGGVHVLAADGTRLGLVGIQARTSNVEIDAKRHVLYVTADRAVYAIPLRGEG